MIIYYHHLKFLLLNLLFNQIAPLNMNTLLYSVSLCFMVLLLQILKKHHSFLKKFFRWATLCLHKRHGNSFPNECFSFFYSTHFYSSFNLSKKQPLKRKKRDNACPTIKHRKKEKFYQLPQHGGS